MSRMAVGSALILGLLAPTTLVAQQRADTLRAYGPGGPLPALKEAAAVYGAQAGVHIEVTGGPTAQWLERARKDADLIFSGSEHMMSDFIGALEGQIVESSVMPLYLREAAILVRPGNPRRITGFPDLLQPGMRVLVVNGAGQTGLWEDMAGRAGNIEVVRALRRNIVEVAPNSGVAKERWQGDATLDAWIIWTIWQVANRDLADAVAPGSEWTIFRDTGIALTQRGERKQHARRFVDFLLSASGAAIFRKWGWVTADGAPR